MQRAAELIATQHERERQAEQRGFRRGYRAGYAACDDDWHEALAPARALARRTARSPRHDELEVRRWGPGGREHAGDARPGDYAGLGGAA
ncbi:MAG: hypothetical protein ACLP52_01250 [Streptosporangiaceae bacterium]